MPESPGPFLLRALRIPERPHIPPGEEAHAEVFRAGQGYYTYLLLGWILRQTSGLIGLLVGTWVLNALVTGSSVPGIRVRGLGKALQGLGWELLLVLEIFAWGGFLLAAVGSFLLLSWDFQCRFYVLTDRCLRIQEGLWAFREQTFSLSNIQDLDVRRGPLQRLLGVGDLVVRTAGGGDTQPGAHHGEEGPNLHTGRLRGVADPERLRDRLLQLMREKPRGTTPAVALPSATLAHAAAEAAREARALRLSLS